LPAEMIERARLLLAAGSVQEERRPGEPTQEQRMAALNAWHDEWERKHEADTPFRPELNRDVADYNLHYVDLEAPAEAQIEYNRRAREILGLDPETGRAVNF
jgi:hypothetical protein